MVFRRNRQKRSAGRSILGRILTCLLCLIAVVALLLIFLVNGTTLKKPLCAWLSQATGTPVTIAEAEYSPLYPGTLRVKGLQGAGLNADELYLEADLLRSLQDKTLHLSYVFARNLQLPDATVPATLAGKAHLQGIAIEQLQLEGMPVQHKLLQSPKATLTLNDVKLTPEQGVQFAGGNGSFPQARCAGLELKSLNFSFTLPDEAEGDIQLQDVQARLAGGTLTASAATISPAHKQADFQGLNLSGLIFKNSFALLHDWSVTADSGHLNSIFWQNQDFTLSGLAGTYKNMQLQFEGYHLGQPQYTCSLELKGSADNLAMPEQQLLIDSPEFTFSTTDKLTEGSLKGGFMEGELEVAAAWAAQSHTLTVRELNLNHNKLELYPKTYALLQQLTSDPKLNIELQQADLQQVSFLSYVNTLPVSAEGISAQVRDLTISHNAEPDSADGTGLISLSAHNLMYADLQLQELSSLLSFNRQIITLSVPVLRTAHSAVSVNAAWDKAGGPSYMLVEAPEFNLSDLSSELTGHIFDGTVSLHADLKSRGRSLQELREHLQGHAVLTSPHAFVSGFGLDLLTDPHSTLHKVSLSDLKDFLQHADCGMNELNMQAELKEGTAYITGSFTTPASQARLESRLDTVQSRIAGQLTLYAPLHEQNTVLSISNTLQEPEFVLSRHAATQPLAAVPAAEPEDKETPAQAEAAGQAEKPEDTTAEANTETQAEQAAPAVQAEEPQSSEPEQTEAQTAAQAA